MYRHNPVWKTPRKRLKRGSPSRLQISLKPWQTSSWVFWIFSSASLPATGAECGTASKVSLLLYVISSRIRWKMRWIWSAVFWHRSWWSKRILGRRLDEYQELFRQHLEWYKELRKHHHKCDLVCYHNCMANHLRLYLSAAGGIQISVWDDFWSNPHYHFPRHGLTSWRDWQTVSTRAKSM